MQCIASSAPARISTSPTLKTLLTGNELGIQNTSPRNCRCGWVTAPEFVNPAGSSAKPAFSSARGAAGITPPFAAIAVKFSAPPSATSHTHGMWRLSTTKTAAMT